MCDLKMFASGIYGKGQIVNTCTAARLQSDSNHCLAMCKHGIGRYLIHHVYSILSQRAE